MTRRLPSGESPLRVAPARPGWDWHRRSTIPSETRSAARREVRADEKAWPTLPRECGGIECRSVHFGFATAAKRLCGEKRDVSLYTIPARIVQHDGSTSATRGAG